MKLTSDPFPGFLADLKGLGEGAWQGGVLDDREKKFLLPSICSTPYFYHLLKVHNSLINPPGRPIVASMNSFTSGLSIYIDYFLRPIVSQLPFYIRDFSHVLEVLKVFMG